MTLVELTEISTIGGESRKILFNLDQVNYYESIPFAGTRLWFGETYVLVEELLDEIVGAVAVKSYPVRKKDKNAAS